jgi:hypothetical protein
MGVRARLAYMLVVAAAGCGEEPAQREPAATTPTPTPTADRTAGLDPEKAEIRRAADAYYAALARKDFRAVCDTLAPSERRHFAARAAGCPNAFADLSLPPRKRRILRDFRAGEVRVRGDRATIELTLVGSRTVIAKLYALREDDRWGISRRNPDR